jgi:shikimate dehydrogenase
VSVTPHPRRLVLLGHPVAHSLSPRFQQAALDHHRIALRYEALDVAPAQLRTVVAELIAEGAAGNVTLPHKTAFASLCTQRSALAARADAVNTFWCDADGALHGDNTDVGGFLFAIRQLLGQELRGLHVVMLGAGGAASGVAEALREIGDAKLTVHARNPQAAAVLSETFGAIATDGSEPALVTALASAQLVVNATSLGIDGSDELPLPPALVPPGCAALDLTYRRDGLTPWVHELRARNRSADDGKTMLLEQGALAFERWFGIEAPRVVMARAIGR